MFYQLRTSSAYNWEIEMTYQCQMTCIKRYFLDAIFRYGINITETHQILLNSNQANTDGHFSQNQALAFSYTKLSRELTW